MSEILVSHLCVINWVCRIIVPSVVFRPQRPQTVFFLSVLSRLFYCSSLLSLSCLSAFSISSTNCRKFKTRLLGHVHKVPKTDHISSLPASLHWLPDDSRIKYKLSSLCNNCLSSTAPVYVTKLLKIYKLAHQLRSSSHASITCLPLCPHPLLVRYLFLMLHKSPLQSSVMKHTPKSSPKSHLLKLNYQKLCVCMCVCGCGYVCVCLSVCVCVSMSA